MSTLCEVCGKSRSSRKVNHTKCSEARAARGFQWLHTIASKE